MAEESTVGKLFAGTFPRTMDAKNRVSLPSDWKIAADDSLYVVPSLDQEYLAAMTPAIFASKQTEIRAKVPDDDWPEIRRSVFGGARLIKADKQGRILVPDDLCRVAGITGNATLLIGVIDNFEIWEPTKRAAPATKDSLSEAARKAVKNIGF